MNIQPPVKGEYPAYYENHFALVDMQRNILDQMHEDAERFGKFITLIPEEKWHYAYAPGKWSVLSVIQHTIDTERIMTYRAMCFARGEKLSLPGFDENAYAEAADMKHKNTAMLSLEWLSVRQASLSFYLSLSAEEAKRIGTGNNNVVSVSAIAYVSLGHARHHFKILHERYLNGQ